MCYSFEFSSLIMALKVTINSSLCTLCRSNTGSSQNRYILRSGGAGGTGRWSDSTGETQSLKAHPPRERSHSNKGCGVTLSSYWQPGSAGHSAWAKAGNLTVLSHSFPVLYLQHPGVRPRHTELLPCAAATQQQALKVIKSWEDGSTKGIQELLSCSPLCGMAILGSTPNDNSPVSAIQGALGCYPEIHGLLLMDSYLAVTRASGSHQNSHKCAFVLLIHLAKTDASKGTKKHVVKEKLSERNFRNVTPASPLIIF